MRDYKISTKKGEMWTVKVSDSYGKIHANWFPTKDECIKYVYYIWDNEISPEDREMTKAKTINKLMKNE